MEVEGSTTFSMGVNCSYVGMERPWRVLESSARIQSFKSISVAWVDELVGAVRLTNLLKILRKISKIVEIKSRDINITRILKNSSVTDFRPNFNNSSYVLSSHNFIFWANKKS